MTMFYGAPGLGLQGQNGRAFPQQFYDAIAASESGGYNIGGYSYFGVTGQGTAGSQTLTSSNGQQVTLATYHSPEEAYQALDNLLTSGRYAPAFTQYQISGNINQFVSDIANAGYVQADQKTQWISNIESLLNNQGISRGYSQAGIAPFGGNPNNPGVSSPGASDTCNGTKILNFLGAQGICVPKNIWQRFGFGTLGFGLILLGAVGLIFYPEIGTALGANQAASELQTSTFIHRDKEGRVFGRETATRRVKK